MDALVAHTRCNPVEVPPGASGFAWARLPVGYHVVGGGHFIGVTESDEATKVVLRDSRPDGEGWLVLILNRSTESVAVQAYVFGIAHRVSKAGFGAFITASGQVPT